jgi:hypothetical protein
VLEVGAGLGATTRLLCTGRHRRWLCLEPDPHLAAALADEARAGNLPDCCEPRTGTLADLGPDEQFDAAVYIDVLEHIADDRAELAAAADHLRVGGKLIVLSPAHQWLFTPFDEAIGHYRRYSKRSLRAAAPAGLACRKMVYLDSVGLLASLGNRLFLRSSMPSARQLWVWDRLMVPLSRVLDPVFAGSLGKSVLGIWQKTGVPAPEVDDPVRCRVFRPEQQEPSPC